MNCKPDQLCRVIDDPDTRLTGTVDKIIRVKTAYQWHGLTLWTYEGPQIRALNGYIRGFADELLRPIDGGETPEESTEAMRDLTSIPSEVTA